VDAAVEFVCLAGSETAELVLLHVDDRSPVPEVQVDAGFRTSRRPASAPLERALAQAAEALQPDLLVMVTHGLDAVADIALSSQNLVQSWRASSRASA
jgi:hypothetical protein